MTEWLERVRSELAGRYRIERELGRGSTATVYLADDLAQQRQVAVKVLHPELVQAVGGQRFLREIRLAASLHHPHLMAIHDSGEANGLFYFVGPYLPDGSLRTLLNRERQLSVDEALRITHEIADALGYVHEQGIVHRDVKPENVLFAGKHACVADFGIARAIEVVVGDTLTSTGLVVGTPAYMSPEQASGERAVDARSDQYSLACVLYEMVAGIPPFVGATAQSVISQRFAHAPSPLTFYRPNVPAAIEGAVARALSIAPADRFDTVADFVAALDRRAAPAARIDPAARLRVVRRRWFAAGVATAFVILAVFGFAQAYPRMRAAWGMPLDSARYVVLPFLADPRASLSGADAAAGMYRVLEPLRGLPLVDEAAVQEATARRPVASLSTALRVARQLGAGRLIWGAVTRPGTSDVVRVNVYDVALGSTSRDTSVTVSRSGMLDTALGTVARSLLRGPNVPAAAAAGDFGTDSYAAWSAYMRGHAALARWNVATAEREFSSAAANDPGFVHAHLWRAVLHAALLPGDAEGWAESAAIASEGRSRLSQREGLLAGAVYSLARGDYPRACSFYDQLTRVQPRDAWAWYGAAECRFVDKEVVSDRRVPSGWRFRSSFHTAIEAYLQAISVEPRSLALPIFARLDHLLPSRPREVVSGKTRGLDSWFLGFPVAAGDSVAFAVYPSSAHAAGAVPMLTPAHSAALARNRETLLRVARDWVGRDSESDQAYAALARVLEKRGEVLELGSSEVSALTAIRRARRLASERNAELPLVISEIRILLKREDFVTARAVADSALARRDPRPTEAGLLAGIATLLGRPEKAADLAVKGGVTVAVGHATYPGPVKLAAARLLTHAALGVCDALPELERNLSSALTTHVEPQDRASVRRRLLEIPIGLAGKCEGGQFALRFGPSDDEHIWMHQQMARGNPAGVRRTLDRIDRRRAVGRIADISLDYAVQEATLRLASGDTVGAVRKLDSALEALPAQGATLVSHIPEAAALPRAMALRALIGLGRRDEPARKWAKAVVVLWSGCEPKLRPIVERLAANRRS